MCQIIGTLVQIGKHLHQKFREMWSTTLKSIMLALAPFYFHKILKEELEMEKSIIDRRK